jgi:CheY-like chemotaxis protein
VDDEPYVLEGLRLNLRRSFDIATAGGGAEALELVSRGPPFAVIVSDMRMPGMDGATFLARARELAPETVRILLTGHADLDSALAAVNEGQVFRFLTKPCPAEQVRDALEQGAEHHRLVVAERELLEKTLTGAVKALADILAMTSPGAFGRASRLLRIVTGLCQRLQPMDRWAIEVAAQLSQIGFVALPPALADKVYEGGALSPAERALVDRAPLLADQLLAHVPRLEPVREILAAAAPHVRLPEHDPGLPPGARILLVAMEQEALESRGASPAMALATLESRLVSQAPKLLAALQAEVADRTATTIQELELADIQPGMVLADDVRGRNGVLLVARGHAVSAGLLARLQGMGVTGRLRMAVSLGLERKA